jgi:hypothetical protein
MRSPTEGKPTFITPKSNRCSKHQVYVPEASDQAVGKAKKRLRSEDDEDTLPVPSLEGSASVLP